MTPPRSPGNPKKNFENFLKKCTKLRFNLSNREWVTRNRKIDKQTISPVVKAIMGLIILLIRFVLNKVI